MDDVCRRHHTGTCMRCVSSAENWVGFIWMAVFLVNMIPLIVAALLHINPIGGFSLFFLVWVIAVFTLASVCHELVLRQYDSTWID